MSVKILAYFCAVILIITSLTCTRTRNDASLHFQQHGTFIDTLIVQTSTGTHRVLVQTTLHVPYVKYVVDSAYQSLNVFVPLAIDSITLDASKAPMLFSIGVGAFKAVNNWRTLRLSQRKGASKNRKIELALTAGFVVVEPGCRGRENRFPSGMYYGKAPAGIVDLKAALRYLRYNEKRIPGDMDKIITLGCSAGGAFSALLGVSGNSKLFEPYLKEIGAPREDDHVFACACYSPIIDLEHADMAYEWMFGNVPTKYGLVNQKLSKLLREQYAAYQASLNLYGNDTFGLLTAENYDKYLLQYYLFPSATAYLQSLSDEQRTAYLAKHPWIHSDSTSVSFTFSDFVQSLGRLKGLPAFDDFQLRTPSNSFFGNAFVDARHFTRFGIQYSKSTRDTALSQEVEALVRLMNPQTYLLEEHADCAHHWWLRNGTLDNHTSFTVMTNFALLLERRGFSVDCWFYWDAGHCGDTGGEDLIEWMKKITEYNPEN